MKPRERVSQKQTSRISLRRHDHRDVVFDKKFHNAIYLVKSEKIDDQGHIIEPGYSGYAWLKYPHNAILTNGKGICSIAWMDLDRQFQYSGVVDGGTGDTDWIRFKNFAITISQSGFCIVTKDGIHFKKQAFQYADQYDAPDHPIHWQVINIGNFDNGKIWKCHVNDNDDSDVEYFCGITNRHTADSSGGAWLRIFSIKVDDDLNIDIGIPVIITLNSGKMEEDYYEGENLRYQISRCYGYAFETSTGCVVLEAIKTRIIHYNPYSTEVSKTYQYKQIHTDGWYRDVYRKDNVYWGSSNDPSFRTLVYNAVHAYRVGYSLGGPENPATLKVGRISLMAYAKILAYGKVPYVTGKTEIIVATTTNEGEDITYTSLDLFDTNATDTKVYLFFTDGYFYVMYGNPNHLLGTVYMVKSLDGINWEQVYLPRWVDVDILKNSGVCTDRNPAFDKVRIAIETPNTEDYNATLYSMLGNDTILFRDGEFNDTKETFYLYLVNNDFGAIFNNQYLATNSKSFAWKRYLEQSEGAHWPEWLNNILDIYEPVMRYDYCAPAGGFEGDTPDPDLDFVWYVWNEEDLVFDVVDRHLSTYSGYTIMVVQELPETGQPMILYGVKTDLNADPLYDYYVWDMTASDFVSVTDLTIYSKYTFVKVQSLPLTGAANVIYAVPKDTSSYDTYMYIWNPDAIRYVPDGEDDQGNPKYKEVHGDYEDINTTEYDMTGKKYRTVNVKTLPDRGYVGVIYISEQKYTKEKISEEDRNYNYYQWDETKAKFVLCSAVINKAKFEVREVEVLVPPLPGEDFSGIIFKILKEIDGKNLQNLWEDESTLINYLKSRTWVYGREFLNSVDDLPFVGESHFFYIVKETPGIRTGIYSVYMWDKLNCKYNKTNTYEYLIANPPTEEEKSRLVKFIDWVDDAIGDTIYG